jgi:ATP adenylyltransferase
MQESWELPGAPNAFQHLWTPHRLVYIKEGQQPGEHECPFCLAPAMQDDEALIVHRGTHAYVILNLFPYNSGHLLICPYRHIPTYGYNIGMNQGEVAGAGIAGHLHQHVVPRWRNDSNFFPIIAETKAIPRLLGEVRDELAEAWLKF